VELCSGVSDLILRFRFVCDPDLPPPVLGVALLSEDRKPVTSSSTLNDRVPVSRDAEGYGEICVRYPAIPLLKGRYSVDAWLLDETGLHAYDHAAAAVGLRIVQQGVEQGLVALPHLWTHTP
jgi:lipopolysaccharide transport system ATP-binding protein